MHPLLKLFPCSVLLLLASCGYVGPVLPPSPQLPNTITDLAAIERGDKIIVTFTAPPRTTDGVAITHFSSIELRIGESKMLPVPLPPPSDKDDPQPKPIAYEFPAADYIGNRIALSVHAAVKKTGHYSAWSNTATLEVIAPLATPVVHAEGSAGGIVLTWEASDDAQYRIERQGPANKQPLDLATSNEPRYVDVSAQYDTEYHYIVTAKKGAAESLPSRELVFSAADKYPPAVPSGITALAGPDAINLAWQRNTEPDLQGYFVYRSTDNGVYAKQGAMISLPSYVDRNIEHGKTYSYKISSIDKTGNESAQSAAVEAQY